MTHRPQACPLDRRQWLKAVGTALAGLVLASRLPFWPAGSVDPAGPHPGAAAARPIAVRDDRRYILGFESDLIF